MTWWKKTSIKILQSDWNSLLFSSTLRKKIFTTFLKIFGVFSERRIIWFIWVFNDFLDRRKISLSLNPVRTFFQNFWIVCLRNTSLIFAQWSRREHKIRFSPSKIDYFGVSFFSYFIFWSVMLKQNLKFFIDILASFEALRNVMKFVVMLFNGLLYS